MRRLLTSCDRFAQADDRKGDLRTRSRRSRSALGTQNAIVPGAGQRYPLSGPLEDLLPDIKVTDNPDNPVESFKVDRRALGNGLLILGWWIAGYGACQAVHPPVACRARTTARAERRCERKFQIDPNQEITNA